MGMDLIIQILPRLPVQSLYRFICVYKQWGLLIKEQTLMIQILCRLPVQSLLRFTCVSKQWGLVIKDETFIKLHLQQSKETNTLVFSHYCDGKILSIDLNSMLRKETIPPTDDFGLQLIGTFNGLICFSSWHSQDLNWFEDIVLWNMSTGEHLILPSVPGDDCYPCKLRGFGYDSTNDDYKVIKIFKTKKYSNAIIYSLRTKSWGKINRSTYRYCDKIGAYARGAFHWFAWDKQCTFIMAFNCNTEKQQILQLPFREKLDSSQARIKVLGEDLIVLDGRFWPDFVEIWVMKEYGVKESWTRLFTVQDSEVGLRNTYFCYLCCFKNGDEEVLVVAPYYLVYYNLRNNSNRRLPNYLEFEDVLMYRGSLVRILDY